MADYKNEKCIACNKTFQENDDIVVCPQCGTPYHRDCYKQNGKCINNRLHELNLSWYDEKQKEKQKENESKQKKNNFADAENIQNNANFQNNSNNPNGTIICKHCSMPNSPSSTFCARCGQLLNDSSNEPNNSYDNNNKNNETNKNNPFERINKEFENVNVNLDVNGQDIIVDFKDPYGGFNPNDDFEGAKLSNVAEFVNSNRVMLLLLFKKFKSRAAKISTNIACLFFPYAYFAYRKMWKMSLAIITLFTLLSIPSILCTFIALDTSQITIPQTTDANLNAYYEQIIMVMENFQTMLSEHEVLISNLSTIFEGISLAVRLLLFFFGNYIYYRYCIKTVKDIQDNTQSDLIVNECRYRGGIRFINVLLSFIIRIGFAVIAYMAVLSALLYQL
jgi:hypothetical protein